MPMTKPMPTNCAPTPQELERIRALYESTFDNRVEVFEPWEEASPLSVLAVINSGCFEALKVNEDCPAGAVKLIVELLNFAGRISGHEMKALP